MPFYALFWLFRAYCVFLSLGVLKNDPSKDMYWEGATLLKSATKKSAIKKSVPAASLKIGQKLDLVIPFDWGVLLTQCQRV